ncbi:unnamed protein product, partial [Mesorhabditis spiculigera]
MLPASRIAAVALSKNLAANCARTTSVAFVHIDRHNPPGIGEKHEQMKMSTENMEHRKDAMTQKAKHIKDNVTDSNMGETIKDIKENLGDKVYNAKESVKETAQEAKEAVTGNKTMGEKMGDLKDKAVEKAHDAKEYMMGEKSMGEKAEDLKDTVKGKAHEMKGYGKAKLDEAKDKAEDAYDRSGKTASSTMEQVKEKVADTYQQAKEVVGEKVQQAKEVVGEKVDELKTMMGGKEVKANPNEFVPHFEVMENSYFDNIHDIDRIKGQGQPGPAARQPRTKNRPDGLQEESHFDYDLTMDRGDSQRTQEKVQQAQEDPHLQEKLKKETEKRSKLADPDPEQFVPRKEMADNAYFDHQHNTDTMQAKQEGLLKMSLSDILREELERRQISLGDLSGDFSAHMEVTENQYFDDIHNVDEMKRDQTPGEEADAESERAGKKMDPFMTEKSGEAHLRK